jgi:leucyl/phenylalanyl-tRNA--protein transferase
MNVELTPELLLRAYASGIFPMGDDFGGIRWYSPDPRCIFDLETFHIPKRLMRTYKHDTFELKVNADWPAVVKACANRPDTWISAKIFAAYTRLHELGFAHTVEAYKGGTLAGGLYGVALGGAFFGESMFYKETDASKVCLVYLVERMKDRGFTLLDSQFITRHLSTFGAVSISRLEYLERLQHALTLDCKFA